MDREAELKLQSFLDGELSESDAKQVASWLAKDQEAVLLLAELRQTRQSFAGFEAGIRLPEAREFYWSKIQREIERLDTAEARPPAVSPSLYLRLRRLLFPATAIALLAIAGVLVTHESGATNHIQTSTSDPGAFTYRDYAGGTTLVWLSYPADNEIAQNDSTDTFE